MDDEKSQSRSSIVTLLDVGKEGYLTKRGQNRKSWRKRYFVLIDKFLYYYKNENEFVKKDSEKGFLNLRNAMVVKTESKNKKRFTFYVQEKVTQRILYLYATNSQQREEWYCALNNRIDSLEEHMDPPSMMFDYERNPLSSYDVGESEELSDIDENCELQENSEDSEIRGHLQVKINSCTPPVSDQRIHSQLHNTEFQSGVGQRKLLHQYSQSNPQLLSPNMHTTDDEGVSSNSASPSSYENNNYLRPRGSTGSSFTSNSAGSGSSNSSTYQPVIAEGLKFEEFKGLDHIKTRARISKTPKSRRPLKRLHKGCRRRRDTFVSGQISAVIYNIEEKIIPSVFFPLFYLLFFFFSLIPAPHTFYDYSFDYFFRLFPS